MYIPVTFLKKIRFINVFNFAPELRYFQIQDGGHENKPVVTALSPPHHTLYLLSKSIKMGMRRTIYMNIV